MKIEQLIYEIQKRPGMFVKEERLDYIFYLLSGYCGANHALPETEDTVERNFSVWFNEWLLMWIENNIDKEYTPKTLYWYDNIKEIVQSGENEFDVFFELCKSFFEDYKDKKGYFSDKEYTLE